MYELPPPPPPPPPPPKKIFHCLKHSQKTWAQKDEELRLTTFINNLLNLTVVGLVVRYEYTDLSYEY